MSWFWTTGILVAAGLFALLLFINPNISWTVKRLNAPIRSLFFRKRDKPLKTKNYGLNLKNDNGGRAKNRENQKDRVDPDQEFSSDSDSSRVRD